MNDKAKPHPKQTYKYHVNAVCVSVYSPTGETIPAEVRKEIEDSVWSVANEHRLLINIAYT
jgi:hypothetical protein